MHRRQFLATGAAASIGGVLPNFNFIEERSAKDNARHFSSILEPIDARSGFKEFHLFVDLVQHEIVPGVSIHTLAFNGTIPGPEIRVNEGDRVRVHFENRTGLNHTIHWHGLHVPWRMDGVPYMTQLPVMPDQTFVYEFDARPYGTHIYHCHWGTMLHMQAGMYGAIIVDPAEGQTDPIQKVFPYEREYTLVYSSHDTNFIRNELNIMLERMKERRFLMQSGRFEKERFGLFADIDDLKSAMANGYHPPYTTRRRTSADLPDPNFFTINGKSYPETPRLMIREGENIRVRLINAGASAHSLHLHGTDFWVVADDGYPLANPQRMNTILLAPGKTHDIIIPGDNPGIWAFHDHDTRRATNNGVYPGGTLTALVYEDLPYMDRLAMPSMAEMQEKDSPEQMTNVSMDMDGLTHLPFISLDQ
ncbi:MAG: multicopper oxidase domain-containing protein [Bacteroidetes bacterium]|nr:multicopper oxidase domain-containing protein [Bacteroidota bacterium]